MEKASTPIRPADDEARALARSLIDSARHGALAVLNPESGLPVVSRIAVARDADGMPISLISTLSGHTQALAADPRASLLLGEPGVRGDPLTHPRVTLQVEAEFVPRGSEAHARLRNLYLCQQPKAQLYIDFGDFRLVRLRVVEAMLNGGFGKAFTLSADDLRPAPPNPSPAASP